ncbi:MAG TPA: RNA methyltransferase [Candidatus Megaira endosymbiont of Nemacystus decipiens]|nr:RNA methyltransferase [Candidatus Megaera endosymbiont of Nemacystus decipiens]
MLPSIILIKPQMAENIGATARAMKNFGILDLRIVSPSCSWPNQKAQATSVRAIDIINKAKIFNTISEALSDLSYVYATTSITRDMSKECLLSRDLGEQISKQGKVGIMFGRESIGLTNEEIAYANKIITIDTDIEFNSLNISHAVAVICYQIFQLRKQSRLDLKLQVALATQKELEVFYTRLFNSLQNKNFFKVESKRCSMQNKIRNLFSKIDHLSSTEVQILHGIVKTLSK